MFTRDSYVALLEKRAFAESSIPENDSAEATNAEVNKNREDSRQYLSTISGKTDSVEKDMSEAKRRFSRDGMTTVVGHPFLKTAGRDAFFAALQSRGLMKAASAVHLEITYGAFCDELEKISALKPQTLAQVAQKNQVAMSMPAKVWDIGKLPTKLPPGSGTSVFAKR